MHTKMYHILNVVFNSMTEMEELEVKAWQMVVLELQAKLTRQKLINRSEYIFHLLFVNFWNVKKKGGGGRGVKIQLDIQSIFTFSS